MTLQEFGTVIGIVVASSGVLGGAGKYYLDAEYVAENELEQQFIQRDLRGLNRDLRKLKRIPEVERTDREQWEIEGIEDEIDDLQQEYDQLSTG